MLKNKETKTSTELLLLFGFSFLLLFIIIYKSPLRLDDLTWGSRIGMERLESFFADYNGRYIGNLIVIVLTRLPAILRAFIEVTVIAAFLYVMHVLLNRKTVTTALFYCIFIMMPLEIFSQTVTWTAGFSNYFFSLMFVTTLFYVDVKVLKKGEDPTRVTAILFLIIAFLGQFFVETSTLYIIAISFIGFFLNWILNKKKSVFLILQFIISSIGGVMMFINGAYLGALTHDGSTYKSIEIGNSIDLIINILKAYRDSVCYKWFGINATLNFVLALVLVLFCAFKSNKKIFTCIGSGFLALFIYDLIDKDSRALLSPEAASIISVLFFTYLLAVTVFVIKEKDDKIEILLILASHLILMIPLNAVSPINERCFLITYSFWAILLVKYCMLIPGMDKVLNSVGHRTLLLSIGIIICFYLIATISSLRLSWQIEQMRMEAIETFKSGNDSTLILPSVPEPNLYCYGANLSGDYWLGNYKEYYGIDDNVELVFMDYEEYTKSNK